MIFSRIYFKALALITIIIALYTGVIVFFVSPEIEERAIHLEEKTGKAQLQKISTVVESSVRELKSYEKNSIALHKKELENITDVAFTLVEELYTSSQPKAVKEHIISEVKTFRDNLSDFYQHSRQHDSPQLMQEFIKEFVKSYRYGEGSGYFFINQGTGSIVHPIEPGREGKDWADIKDEDGTYFIREFVKRIKNEKEGFVSYKWFNPSSKKVEDKLTYIFYFEPFDWIIGTGVYFAEVTRQKQKKAIEYVNNLRYGDNEYFYISDYNSVLISHPSLQGKDMSKVKGTEGILIVPPMVKVAREQGQGFHSYSWNKLQSSGQSFRKLTFSKHIPVWKWVIGTGIYLDSVELEVETKKNELIKDLRKLLTTIKIADTGYVYIFDSKGNMIIHPNSNIEGKNFTQLRNPGKNSFIFDDLINAYTSGGKTLYYAWDKPSDKGNYIYDKVSWIDYNEDFDWYICSSAYIAEINSTANKLKQYLWIISFILLSLALFSGAYFFKKLLNPIESLSHNALQVKNGDLSVRSQIRSDDEIGTLAQTFDGMLDTIENNIQTLDKKVNERTKDLQESEKRLQAILRQAPLGILIADAQTMRIQYANPAVCKLLDYNKEELESMGFASLHTPVDYIQVSKEFEAQAGGEKNIAIDIPFLRKDGTLFELDVNAAPIELDKRLHLAAFLVDRTETKKLGLQLQHAQKMEAIGIMAGGVAHDLNNILSGIVSYPELLLLQLPESSELRIPLEAIQESGKRAAMVVADLLTVAKSAASTRESYDLNALIDEYLNSPECKKLHSLHPGVACKKQLAAEQSIISCSPIHIKKIVMNLFANAMEAISEKGSVSISTYNQQLNASEALEHGVKAGNYVVMAMQDTGLGISDKDLVHIFEPFYTKKFLGQSGTGLGLAIVWNTVQDHNGRIVVESSEEGTLFRVYLPVSTEVASVQADKGKLDDLTGNNESILVVDDEPILRDIAAQMLHALGYNVESVSSGELAIQFVQEKPVDLIVLDMMMEPGMNGHQTYEEILKLYPDQRAIIASGFSESDDIKATLRLGAGGFIKKPYSMDKLGRVVKEALTS